MAMVEARNLHKRFVLRRNALGRAVEHHVAVEDVSLTVEIGKTVAIVGESGAGKSTVGRVLLRLVEPDAGTIHLDGTDVRSLRRAELRRFRRRMQMIFQDPFTSLDPRRSIGSAVEEPLQLFSNANRVDRRERVERLLERVGIRREQAERLPAEFSGGQLQRVAIARALAVEPALLVCDEPVAALDVSIRAQVINLLHELQEESGLAMVFISHDLSLVRRIADEIIVMRRGRVVDSGTPRHVFEESQEPYTKLLLDSILVADPRLAGLAPPRSGIDGCRPVSSRHAAVEVAK